MTDYNDEAAYMWWYQTGAEKERERIITLLEAQDYADGKAAHNDNPSGICRICRAIALIKGESE